MGRERALTDAALWPPLAGKEVDEGSFNFDLVDVWRHFRKQSSPAGEEAERVVMAAKRNVEGFIF